MSEPSPNAAEGSDPATSALRITPTNVGLVLAAGFAVTFAFLWTRAFVQMSTHGFDVSDEGNYLLAYRWWSVNHRTYTGNQYLYGPVFQLLGYDIARLRLFRLFTIVAAHGLFGLAFMQWLRSRRPRAPESGLWEVAGTAAIVAASGLTTAWLPLSAGYNDVSLLGAVLATAFVLRVAALVERDAPIPRWLPAAFGPLVVMMALAKWASSFATLGPTVLVAVILVVSARGVRAGAREVARLLGWTLGGAAVFLLFLNVFVVRLDKVMPEILEVNRILMKKGNPPAALLRMYWDSSVRMLKASIDQYELAIVAAGVVAVGRSRGAQLVSGLLAVVAVDRALTRVEQGAGLVGGTSNLPRYALTIEALALAALALGTVTLVVGWLDRRRRRRAPSLCRESPQGWLILGLLAILPITHGLGTGNELYVMVMNGFAGWMALIIAIVTGMDTSPRVARIFGGALAASAVAASVLITKSGLLERPYRTDGLAQSRTPVAGVPALRRIKLRQDVAQRFSQLHAVLQPYIDPPGRAMMGFDEISGVVLAMDGRPVGESWAAAGDHERTADGLRASCADGHPWWEARRPVLLFQRAVTHVERKALADCGIDFATDYKLLAPPAQTIGLSVYVPTHDGP